MVTVHCFSEVGGHRLNEDTFAVKEHPLETGLWLCFLADGQGGRAGGGVASRVACQAALDAAIESRPERLILPHTWLSIIQQADEAVSADPDAGFTTLVGLCVSQSWVMGASNGDSAALLVYGEKAIELTSGQRKNPPVGSGGAEAVSFSALLTPPWKVIVMSDGVWKYVRWDRVIEAARSEHGAALIEELQRPARLPGNGEFQDDFTVVVLEATA